MFFWKVKTVAVPPPRQQPESKENQEKPSKDEAETQPTVKKTCQIGIDRTVYKLLTKQGKQKRNMKRTRETGEEEKVGWRGPREQPSEIPVKRRIFRKNNLVRFFISLIQLLRDININIQLNQENRVPMHPSYSRKTGKFQECDCLTD